MADDGRGKALLLPVVDGDHAIPVLSHLMQSQRFADVDQVQNVLLEARTSKAHRGLEEILANTTIHSDRRGHFVHISSRLFAQSADGVDRRDTLGQERIGHELGQLRGPQVGGQNSLFGHLFVFEQSSSDIHQRPNEK